MHTSSSSLHICTSTLSISSVQLQTLWIVPLVCLLIVCTWSSCCMPQTAPGFFPTSFSFLLFFFWGVVLVLFSPSPLDFAFAFHLVMQKERTRPSTPIYNSLVKLPLILTVLCILHRPFAFAACFTCTVHQALLHEGISLPTLMWCVFHS